MSNWKETTSSADETEMLGKQLSKLLQGGEIIELVSDLGGGKTTFARGIAKGLGVSENVTSPTFTLSKVYKGEDLELHHYDFYRLSSTGLMGEELKEVLEKTQNITVVEWAGEAHNLFPLERTIRVEIKNQEDENARSFIFSFPPDIEHVGISLGAEEC